MLFLGEAAGSVSIDDLPPEFAAAHITRKLTHGPLAGEHVEHLHGGRGADAPAPILPHDEELPNGMGATIR